MVVQISVSGGILVNDLHDGVDGDWGKQVRMVRHDFGAEGSDSVLDQLLAVIQINWNGHVIDNLESLLEGNLETIRDSGSMESLGEEVLGSSEQSSGNNDDGSSTITGLNVLSLGDFDQLNSQIDEQ